MIDELLFLGGIVIGVLITTVVISRIRIARLEEKVTVLELRASVRNLSISMDTIIIEALQERLSKLEKEA